MKRGIFITFEGIEGSGKSTQIQFAAAWLGGLKIPLCITREPGGTPVGRDIRRILVSEHTYTLNALSEVLLYLADRFEHITDMILPQLKSGNVVLCDRYHDSTVAYQGYGRRIPIQWIQNIWNTSGYALIPDLTFLLDLDPRIGLKRSMHKLRMQESDESRFEGESLEFHKRVRHGFLEIAKQDPKRFRIVDASLPPEQISQNIIEHLKQVLKTL